MRARVAILGLSKLCKLRQGDKLMGLQTNPQVMPVVEKTVSRQPETSRYLSVLEAWLAAYSRTNSYTAPGNHDRRWVLTTDHPRCVELVFCPHYWSTGVPKTAMLMIPVLPPVLSATS
jgi:hypothetical protein